MKTGGGQVENVSSVSLACRKRRLNGAVSPNNRIKGMAPYRCLDGPVKELSGYDILGHDHIK